MAGLDDDNLVDEIAEEFARRWRAGEQPSVEDYVLRYPVWADDLQAVLPSVVMMEQLKPRRENSAMPPRPPVPSAPPERVGDYLIVRELGRGGMGVVYEAIQEVLGRPVAVKLLPGHRLASEQLRARFRREAQAAARLHHTNIVPVFGAGESNGHYYYVMQLIQGRGLDRVIRTAAAIRAGWSRGEDPPTFARGEPPPTGTEIPAISGDEHGSSARPPPETPPDLASLGPRELSRTIARIGVQVADALAYAHTQGVVHRDIKPSNLLQDDRGTVWVTDFGVAQLVEESNLSQSGDLVGTLRYMPPERFAGWSDGRGDVYSLGMTLYEMLTLRPAFPDTTPQHLIQLITHDAPTPPRKLNPDVPADLETIVLKAAARDPNHRYQTAGALADDLRRFLDDQPILARRAGPAARAWRWARRNPSLAATTAFAVLLMALVTLVSVVASVRIAAAQRDTAAANRKLEKALATETAQREQTRRTAALALDALNRTYTRFSPSRLVATPPTIEEGVELPPQPTELPPEVLPLLEDLLATYKQITRSGEMFRSLDPQIADAHHRMGDILQRLGRFDAAAAAYRAAIERYARLLSGVDQSEIRLKLARATNELGRVLRLFHQFDEAKRAHESAIRTLQGGPPAATELPECRYELAYSYYALGQRDLFFNPGWSGPGGRRPPLESRTGQAPDGPGPLLHPDATVQATRTARGNPSAGSAIDLLEQLVLEFPTVPEYRNLLARCYRDLPAGPPGQGGRSPRANRERAVQLLRQLVTEFPRVPDYRFDLCETLGHPGGPTGRPNDPSAESKSREWLREAIRLSAEMVAQYPTVPDYAGAHARYLERLGMKLLRADQHDEAIKLLRQAVADEEQLAGQYPKVVSYTLWLGQMERSLGQALGARGELTEARARLEAAIARMEALWKQDKRLAGVPPILAMSYRDLAGVLSRSGDPARAAQALRKADDYLPLLGPALPDLPPRTPQR